MKGITIVGIRNVNFTADDGRIIVGKSIYINYESKGVDGFVAERIFVPEDKLPTDSFGVGDTINIFYNHRGKVDAIEIVK